MRTAISSSLKIVKKHTRKPSRRRTPNMISISSHGNYSSDIVQDHDIINILCAIYCADRK